MIQYIIDQCDYGWFIAISDKSESLEYRRYVCPFPLSSVSVLEKSMYSSSQEDAEKVLAEYIQNKQKTINEIITLIAQQELGIAHLEERKSDRLDFHELSVASLSQALKRALLYFENNKTPI